MRLCSVSFYSLKKNLRKSFPPMVLRISYYTCLLILLIYTKHKGNMMKSWAETSSSFPWRRTENFSFVTHYSLKSICCSLLVVKLLVTRCKISSLFVAEVARCKKSLVTRCRSCSLQKINRYSLQNLPVTRCRSCLLQKLTRSSLRNSLVTCCKSYSLHKIARYLLQIPLVNRCKKSLVTCCKIPLLTVAKNNLLPIAEVSRCKKSVVTH